MVDRFNNRDASPKLSSDGDRSIFQGGTFDGIRDRLGYLQDLGVGAICLSPVLNNFQLEPTTNNGYSIQDFLQIEPRFASSPAKVEDELLALIDGAHARGIYVFLDVLLNPADDVFEYQDFETDPTRGPYYSVRDTLIRAHQYLIAKYDIDGFRIATLKYIERDFARFFANAIREYALSIGKKNFFTFGEVWDSEEKISAYVGRYAREESELVGVDAALDFPLFNRLPQVVKGFLEPDKVVDMFEKRKRLQRSIISFEGEASKFFVTFLDNHDLNERFYFPGEQNQFADQVTLGTGLLFSLNGIPCLYYGTEQGLSGRGEEIPEAGREALWGKPDAFDRSHPFYKKVRELAAIRNEQPALRYGRLYFRPLSGNGVDFGISCTRSGMLAFSRILNDLEVIVVANTNTEANWTGDVIVDFALNPVNSSYSVLFSNKEQFELPEPVVEKQAGSVNIYEVNGGVTYGPARTIQVKLQPMEIQILRKMS